MAKYRGKHSGQTRGNFKKKRIEHKPENLVELGMLTHQINKYLYTQGVPVEYNSLEFSLSDTLRELEHFDNNPEEDSLEYVLDFDSVYHIGGASVALRSYGCKSGLKEMYIDLVSNDTIDDVVKRITDRFPIFKERK